MVLMNVLYRCCYYIIMVVNSKYNGIVILVGGKKDTYFLWTKSYLCIDQVGYGILLPKAK